MKKEEKMRKFKLTLNEGEEVIQWGYNHDHAIERQWDYFERTCGGRGYEIVKCVLVSPKRLKKP